MVELSEVEVVLVPYNGCGGPRYQDKAIESYVISVSSVYSECTSPRV